MSRTILIVLMSFLVPALLLATGAQEEEESGELSGTVVWSDAESGQDEAYAALGEQFMEMHPGVTVVHEFIDPDQALRTRLAAGEMPDIWNNHNFFVSPTDYPDLNVPLDDLGFTEDNLAGYEMGLGPDGRLYMVTMSSVYYGVQYNRTVFDLAGIETFPTTMVEFYDACEAIKEIGVVPVATAFKDGWPMMPYFRIHNEAIAQNLNGSSSFIADLADQDQLITDDGFGRTLEFLREMNERGYLDEDLLSASWDEAERGFAAGEYAMFYHGSWFTRVLNDRYDITYDEMGMAPLPGSEFVTVNAATPMGIWHESENVPAAKAFLQFLAEDGRYSKFGITEPSIIGAPPNNPLVAELTSYGVPVVSPQPEGAALLDRRDRAEIDVVAVMQEYVLGDDPDGLVESINRRWADAAE